MALVGRNLLEKFILEGCVLRSRDVQYDFLAIVEFLSDNEFLYLLYKKNQCNLTKPHTESNSRSGTKKYFMNQIIFQSTK
jgi:hypothetical protein